MILFKRHRILKLLKQQRFKAMEDRINRGLPKDDSDVLIIKFDVLTKELNTDRLNFHALYMPLLCDNEVKVENEGIYITNEGMKSISTMKYVFPLQKLNFLLAVIAILISLYQLCENQNQKSKLNTIERQLDKRVG